MTKILVIGAAGMLGQGLIARLVAAGTIAGAPIAGITGFDIFPSTCPSSPIPFRSLTGDLGAAGIAESLIADRPDIIFHLAAIVSGEAERDFSKGYAINLDGTRTLFEAIRIANTADGSYCPRVVFTSSLAVFGTPLPDVIGDDHILMPRSSYGTQKAMGELLLADYSRRGFLDGIGIRLPTICIRPGKPNAAASGFFSGILREPLAGQRAVLPVDDSVRHWFASPRAAIGYLVHAAELAASDLALRRVLTMPGLSFTVGDQIEALRRFAGNAAVALIDRRPDPTIEAIISTWPRAFDAKAATALGFIPDASLDAIIQSYLDDHGH